MIQVENLTKYYDDFCAVDQINLNIEKGEIIGLLGPNGAGKTTTLRMLTGYFMPTAGDIRVKDISVNQNPLAIKNMIGYLPESAPLYKGMLVYDYLHYVASIRGLHGDSVINRLQELSDMCGLNDIMHKTIETLSKGLKQRVGLAHAMMSDPEILVLDEPTSGLDPNQIVDIREIIRKIGQKKTVILSTHILSEAEATCDRVVIINKGKIIADGSTHDLQTQSAQTNLIHIGLSGGIEDDVSTCLKKVAGVKQIEVISNGHAQTTSVNVLCDNDCDLRPALYAAIKATDWVLVEFYQETKTLEVIFRELTKEN